MRQSRRLERRPIQTNLYSHAREDGLLCKVSRNVYASSVLSRLWDVWAFERASFARLRETLLKLSCRLAIQREINEYNHNMNDRHTTCVISDIFGKN